MKRARQVLALVPAAATAFLLTSSGIARADDQPPPEVPVSAAVVYPLATNANLPDVISNADLSLIYGRVGRTEGLQLGAVAVNSADGARGAQIGGVVAVAGGPVKGLELSGVANVATSDVTGAQISTVNVSGPIDGLQLGVVNIGQKVRGLQLGVLNIADDVDGASIGLVSISKDSVHPIAWASNLQYMNVGVKFSTKYMFTILGAHYGTLEESDNAGLTAALGGHIPLPSHFDLEVQGTFMQTAPKFGKSESKGNTWVSHHVIAGYSFATHFRLFAGGGVRLPVSVETGREVSRPEAFAGVQF